MSTAPVSTAPTSTVPSVSAVAGAFPPAHLPRFAGKWVLVTGAGTGFGPTLALRAAAEGANVIVHCHSSVEGTRRTVDGVRAYGGDAEVVRADIRSWHDIRQMADMAWRRAGQVDVLINNVGDIATDQMSWRDIDEEVIDRVLAVDIKGMMLMIHEFGLRVLAQGRGSDR